MGRKNCAVIVFGWTEITLNMKKVGRVFQISEFFLSNSGNLGGRNKKQSVTAGIKPGKQFFCCLTAVRKSFLGPVGMWQGAGVGGRDVTPVKWGEDLECV